jgi:hypothetical protein
VKIPFVALPDPAAPNGHVSAPSPAAGKGSVLAALSGEHDGKCSASPPSVGAFEPL